MHTPVKGACTSTIPRNRMKYETEGTEVSRSPFQAGMPFIEEADENPQVEGGRDVGRVLLQPLNVRNCPFEAREAMSSKQIEEGARSEEVFRQTIGGNSLSLSHIISCCGREQGTRACTTTTAQLTQRPLNNFRSRSALGVKTKWKAMLCRIGCFGGQRWKECGIPSVMLNPCPRRYKPLEHRFQGV